MSCPIDYRRQQRERWIEIVIGQGYFEPYKEDDRETVEEIVDAIMASEHSVVAEQGAEIERLKAELAAVRDDWFELGAKLVVSNLWRKEAEVKSREMGVDETHD